jgi:hypothetical protein
MVIDINTFLCRTYIGGIMKTIGTFRVKIHSTSDKKKLKKGNKIYTYGTISIRDPKLNDYVGKEVILKVILEKP